MLVGNDPCVVPLGAWMTTGWLLCGSIYFLSVLDSEKPACLYRSEIPPAGAPPGFDYAAVLGCYVRLFVRPCRSAQDDTEGWLLRDSYLFYSSKLVTDRT